MKILVQIFTLFLLILLSNKSYATRYDFFTQINEGLDNKKVQHDNKKVQLSKGTKYNKPRKYKLVKNKKKKNKQVIAEQYSNSIYIDIANRLDVIKYNNLGQPNVRLDINSLEVALGGNISLIRNKNYNKLYLDIFYSHARDISDIELQYDNKQIPYQGISTKLNDSGISINHFVPLTKNFSIKYNMGYMYSNMDMMDNEYKGNILELKNQGGVIGLSPSISYGNAIFSISGSYLFDNKSEFKEYPSKKKKYDSDGYKINTKYTHQINPRLDLNIEYTYKDISFGKTKSDSNPQWKNDKIGIGVKYKF